MTPPLTLTHRARIVSLNAERSAHWRVHRQLTATWRQAFKLHALAAHHPQFTAPVLITCQPFQARNVLQDAGACVPSLKAAVDGIVDAGVLIDDSPRYVAGLTILAPQRGPDGLTITIEEVP